MLTTPYLQPYNFEGLGLVQADMTVLGELQQINQATGREIATMMQLPEPGFALDLASRSKSAKRAFKHIQQSCLLHATHFEVANQGKTAYIVDEYLWASSRLNPMAIYSSARALLELHAMLHYVRFLLDQARIGPKEDWETRGEKFFKVILQARFGTTDPNVEKLLKADGMADESVQLIRLKSARKKLAEDLPWVEAHYAMLCDFVHHNMSSQRTTGAYAGESFLAKSQSGGMLILPEPAPILQYQFPMAETGRRAIAQTAARALENLRGLISSLNQLARTPFSQEELLANTGSALGMEYLGDAVGVSLPPAGRNELCPCGSGRKYKRCHGR